MTDPRRIPILASARSLYVCADRLFTSEYSQLLLPHLLPNNEISLGKTLIFKDQQFINIIESGFGVPKALSFLFSPYRCCKILFCLWKVGKFYKSKFSKNDCEILLRASLESICTYMNQNKKAAEIFESDRASSMSFMILGSDSKYLIFNQQQGGWSLKIAEKTFSASASLSFNNAESARNASLGKLDSWLSLTSGDIQLGGRIPLLEKFGYVARMVQREVPMPK